MKKLKLKIGDRVWLQIPHNGKVEFIYKNGDIRVELDEIPPQTVMSRFSQYEIISLTKQIGYGKFKNIN